MTKQNIVVRTRYKLSLNNPDRSKIYNSKDQKYVNDIVDYYSNEKKRAFYLVDYFTGKINKNKNYNFVLENGKYATKEEIEKRKKYISKQFNNSNVWQIILSTPQKLVDKNIKWEELEQKLAKEIIPKALKKMGFKDINKMSYGFSLHTNTKNPHFHIYFMEKEPNYICKNNQISYRRKGKIPREVINYLKQETLLTIEREGRFKPLSIAINKDIDEFKKYFNPSSRNFVLYDKENILLEEKILKLGQLLDERYNSINTKIKYNSIRDDEIKTLTKEIKNDIFSSNNELKYTNKSFNQKISEMNNYFVDLAKKNRIKYKDIDYSYTQNKEKYLDNYILNAIVNHSRYNYFHSKKHLNSEISSDLKLKADDIIQAIILNNYKKKKILKKKEILHNVLSNNISNKKYVNKSKISQAVKNINYEMEQASQEFSKLFENDNSFFNNL